MKSLFLKLIFIEFTETFLCFYIGLGLLDIKFKLKEILKLIFLGAISIVLIRYVLNLEGFHAILLLITNTILINKGLKIKWPVSLIAVLLSFILMAISELILSYIITEFTDISVLVIYESTLWLIIFFYLSRIPLFIIGIFIHFKNYKLIDIDSIL